MSTLRLEHAAKIYKSRQARHAAVLNVTLTVEQGDFVFVVGSRGAGKSTLLGVMSGDLRPDRGAVYLDDVDLSRLPKRERARVPEFIGFVPQSSSMVLSETVLWNLASGRRLELIKDKTAKGTQVEKALALVGMSGSEERIAGELTSSERKRVEVARAILPSPDILLLDDVTDRVDEDTVWDLVHLFVELNMRGTTVVMATSASRIVNTLRKRVVTLADGKVVADIRRGRYGFVPGMSFGSGRPWRTR